MVNTKVLFLISVCKMNSPYEIQANDLSLENQFWMINNTEVLHHIERTHFRFPLLIQISSCYLANDAPTDPFLGLVYGDKIVFLVEFLFEEVFKILLGNFNHYI